MNFADTTATLLQQLRAQLSQALRCALHPNAPDDDDTLNPTLAGYHAAAAANAAAQLTALRRHHAAQHAHNPTNTHTQHHLDPDHPTPKFCAPDPDDGFDSRLDHLDFIDLATPEPQPQQAPTPHNDTTESKGQDHASN